MRDTTAYQQKCIRFTIYGMLIERLQINITQNVYIMNEYRQAIIKKRSSSLDTTTGIKELLCFVRHKNIHPIIVHIQIVNNLIGEVMDINNHTLASCVYQSIYYMFKQRRTPYPY